MGRLSGSSCSIVWRWWFVSKKSVICDQYWTYTGCISIRTFPTWCSTCKLLLLHKNWHEQLKCKCDHYLSTVYMFITPKVLAGCVKDNDGKVVYLILSFSKQMFHRWRFIRHSSYGRNSYRIKSALTLSYKTCWKSELTLSTSNLQISQDKSIITRGTLRQWLHSL